MKMQAYFLRRKGLGKGSAEGIAAASTTILFSRLNDAVLPQDPALWCIRWGCTSSVPQKNILNTAKAISEVSNKKNFRLKLGDLAPKTWPSKELYLKEPLDRVIVRPARHKQGKHCYLCETTEIEAAVKLCGPDYYISEYIPKIAEYRVLVVQGRAVWVANKIPENTKAVAWNISQGGKFENVRWSDWPLNVVSHAIRSYHLTTLDFGGIDIMVGPDGSVYTLEINAAPTHESPYRSACTAKAFDYIVSTNNKERIPLGDEGKYLKYIHPAIDNKAIIGV